MPNEEKAAETPVEASEKPQKNGPQVHECYINEVKALLKNYGVKRLPELEEVYYPAFVEELEALTKLYSSKGGNYMPNEDKAAETPVEAPEKAQENTTPTAKEKPEPETENASTLTFEDVQKLAAQKVHEGHTKEVKAMLKNYGVKRLPELKEENYPAFMKELEAL